MRAGVVVSIIGHIGFVMMTMLAWEARSEMPAFGGSVVPVEIVDVAAESNVRALAAPTPEEVNDATSPEEVTPEPAAATPAPQAPPRRLSREEQAYEDFLRRSGLGNLDGPPTPQPQPGDPAATSRPGAGLGTANTASLEDRASALMRAMTDRCWRSTADMPEPERLIVVLEVQLNRNGGLVGQPRRIRPSGNATFDPLMQEAVRRAEQAVRLCDPYARVAEDPVVGEHYDIWRVVQIRFGPRES